MVITVKLSLNPKTYSEIQSISINLMTRENFIQSSDGSDHRPYLVLTRLTMISSLLLFWGSKPRVIDLYLIIKYYIIQ